MRFSAKLIVAARYDALAQPGNLAAPTQILVGELYRETPPSYARRIVAAISGAELHIIPGAGHLSNLENPAAVNARLRPFLGAQG